MQETAVRQRAKLAIFSGMIACLTVQTARAQDDANTKPGPTPRMADGRPDLSSATSIVLAVASRSPVAALKMT
jgi:hypothetical protein